MTLCLPIVYWTTGADPVITLNKKRQQGDGSGFDYTINDDGVPAQHTPSLSRNNLLNNPNTSFHQAAC